MKRDGVPSRKFPMAPTTAVPPSQNARELIQQQLAPITKVMMLPINVFSQFFIWSLLAGSDRNTGHP